MTVSPAGLALHSPSSCGVCVRAGSWWMIEARPDAMILLKRVFARIDKADHDQVKIRRTPEVDALLQWFRELYPFEMTTPDLAELHRGAEHHRQDLRIVREVAGGTYTPRAFDLAVPPRDYQRVAADLWLRMKSLLVADDLGTGKSVVAITGLSAPETRPALVVCLTHLPQQWAAYIARFLPSARTHILAGTKPYDLAEVARKQDAKAGRPDAGGHLPDILICPYSRLEGWAGKVAPMVRSVVYDEVQNLQHHGTAKYRAAAYISEKATYRLALSATPVHNYGASYFSVMELVKPGALGTKDEFMREWATTDMEERKRRIKDPRAFGLHLRERGLMIRRTRKDVGRELPPLTIVPHTIDADPAALDQMKGHAGQLARTILQQTTGGRDGNFQKMRDSAEFERILRQSTGIAKAPYIAAFVRLLVESGERPLVYLWHRAVYEIMAAELRDLSPAFFTGEESARQKEDSLRRFKEGETDILCMSLRAGAGVDGLQFCCRTVVIGELDWSPVVHDQGIGRVARDGQTDPVVAYFLLAEVGSDPTVADVCGAKRANSEPIVTPAAKDLDLPKVDPDHVRRLAERYLGKA